MMRVSEDNIEKEQKIQIQINTLIDRRKSLIFNAGAGAGKTYALTESLKHVISSYGEKLNKYNQKVICITYTNVAVKEIKGRLGNSELVLVSTIHEMLWNVIRNYQNELVEIHKENVECELKNLVNELYNSKDTKIEKVYSSFRKLDADKKEELIEFMLVNKDLFYKSYDKKAADFKKAFSYININFPELLKNVGNFRKTVGSIYKIKNYENCLKNILEGNEKYKAVVYDSRYNVDSLHRMRFSHDTLIEYSLSLINKYKILCKIIVDSHPYFFIDECQDTHPHVVKILSLLDDFATSEGHRFFVGYFGDRAQSIYDDGVGGDITNLHPNLNTVNKNFNRRSYVEIINVINKIRGDELSQCSIYEDSSGGTVKFYNSTSSNKGELIDKFIEQFKLELGDSFEGKIHCLVLTNRLVAELSGFGDFFSEIVDTPYYRKNYDSVKVELLSQDLGKLGSVPKSLYDILNLFEMLNDKNTPLLSIVPKAQLSKYSFKNIEYVLKKLNSISADNLYVYLKNLLNLFSEEDDEFKKIFSSILELESYSFDELFVIWQNYLFPSLEDEEEVSSKLEKILKIDFDIYRKWYFFVTNIEADDVIFHTYHGTKGLEFENVVIIMENDFGRLNRNFFPSFFGNLIKQKFNSNDERLKFESTRNLLYVSCSRSIKNLSVLYLDDVTDFKDGIKSIFGTILSF